MRITVVGAGSVGRTVGAAWTARGHEVSYGVRDPNRADAPAGARTVAEALETPDAVLLTVPGAALPALLGEQGDLLNGRLVLDATNRVGAPALHQLPLFARHSPTARVYRAFCTVGVEVMAQPVVDGQTADLFFCGADGDDRRQVAGLVADVGLRPVYVGDLDAADVVDGVTRLWFALAFGQGLGRHHALRVLP